MTLMELKDKDRNEQIAFLDKQKTNFRLNHYFDKKSCTDSGFFIHEPLFFKRNKAKLRNIHNQLMPSLENTRDIGRGV